MELIAYRSYSEKDFKIHYWRTKKGLEVDFILDNGRIAIEVKISQQVEKTNLKGLIAFMEEHSPQQALVVSQDPRPRRLRLNETDYIDVIPWQQFLAQLWKHQWI